MVIDGRVERPYLLQISCCYFLSQQYRQLCRTTYPVAWKRRFDRPLMCYVIREKDNRVRLLNLQVPRLMSIFVILPQQQANQIQ